MGIETILGDGFFPYDPQGGRPVGAVDRPYQTVREGLLRPSL